MEGGKEGKIALFTWSRALGVDSTTSSIVELKGPEGLVVLPDLGGAAESVALCAAVTTTIV